MSCVIWKFIYNFWDNQNFTKEMRYWHKKQSNIERERKRERVLIRRRIGEREREGEREGERENIMWVWMRKLLQILLKKSCSNIISLII